MSRKAVLSIIIAMNSVRMCTLAKFLATFRHSLKNKKEYLVQQVKLYLVNLIAVHCIREYINSSCPFIVHES